jgi:hypothetical protein
VVGECLVEVGEGTVEIGAPRQPRLGAEWHGAAHRGLCDDELGLSDANAEADSVLLGERG